MQHECVPSAAGGLELGQDASSAQLRGPYAAYSKPRGTETTCPGALSLHTRTHASLPPCSLHTSTSTHTLPWVKTHSLTFTQTVFSHPEGHTHIQKALSAQRVQRDNKTLPYANWTEPESEKGGWQTGEKDPRRQRALYRVWEPRPGASLLGPLAPSWLPKVHCGQGMT